MNVLPDGDNRYRLTADDGCDIGWIRGRAVKVLGFASADQVIAMAQRAWRALQTVLREEMVSRSSEANAPRTLRLVRDAGYEWISDGSIPVARLRQPQRRTGQAWFAIELVVPANAPERLAITAARAIAQAVDPASANATPVLHYIP